MAGYQKSCSVPCGMGERLEEAAGENDMLESEVIRRALRFYEDANPDGLAAFEEVSHGPSVARIETETLVEEGAVESSTDGDDDRADEGDDEDAQDDEEADDETGEEADESPLSGDVYDPCEEGM